MSAEISTVPAHTTITVVAIIYLTFAWTSAAMAGKAQALRAECLSDTISVTIGKEALRVPIRNDVKAVITVPPDQKRRVRLSNPSEENTLCQLTNDATQPLATEFAAIKNTQAFCGNSNGGIAGLLCTEPAWLRVEIHVPDYRGWLTNQDILAERREHAPWKDANVQIHADGTVTHTADDFLILRQGVEDIIAHCILDRRDARYLCTGQIPLAGAILTWTYRSNINGLADDFVRTHALMRRLLSLVRQT